jgi:hypothetical protein
MNFVDSFYREFKQVPMQVYQVEQMYRLGHLTADDAQELVFNLNLAMYLGDRLSSVGELQSLIEHRKRCA